MEINLVEKANELLTEIKELKQLNDMLNNRKQKDTVHFEIVQHYGRNIGHCDIIQINRKHNNRLILEIEKIIKELESELEAL